MQVGRLLIAVSLLAAQSAMAADALTGTFRGDGRACYGALFLRSNTIEWNASFFKCGPTRYKVIEQDLSGDHPHAAFKIEDRRKRCGLAVIEVSRYSEFSWSVKGYPTMEAYQKREEPGWKDSADPARQVALCGMRKE
ncbi:MAG: hypothetical protein QM625_02835 [Ralstonia sp.]|jgi:hypothetical protein|uniref:Uncharacterized protein n=2 Tax=Ralstonia pickettii TaxID=329 RepID=A0A2P4RFI6_RALPI|nr:MULTISPECIES: hypothetical protein [Ralstonia]MBA4202504.1 hypothetical protein [Ralstonia sp.]MBA4233175.1 hypothetical protein [Ralstonia sp.]MBA4238667.1 hypothetical protein [Ralstonia sp.]MBA4280953.1 hypothetical protein [Ralstonia sp.]MBA4298240.1 hypothetical protein [Ralstonia sp.]